MPMPSPAEIKYEMQHITDNRAPELVAALAVNFTLAAIAVILRLASRSISKSPLKADDWHCIAAMIIVIGQLTVNLIGVHLGAGKHVILLKQPVAFAKVVLVSEVFYVIGTALVKFSFLYLYKRLFGSSHRFTQVLYGCGAFVAAYSLVEALVLIFQCRPVRATWDPTVKGDCVNLALGAIIVGSFNVVMDFVTLFLPIRMVWSLKMKRRWKFQLIGIFLLGGFVCIGSIVRVSTVHKLTFIDATWNDVDSAIWAMVENCIGVVSACLPTLRPLFNVISRGHHCSSGQGYCSRCSRPKSGAMSSQDWPSYTSRSMSQGLPYPRDGTGMKIPSQATWASPTPSRQAKRWWGSFGAGKSEVDEPIALSPTTLGPPRLKAEGAWGYRGGETTSDEEGMNLPKAGVQNGL